MSLGRPELPTFSSLNLYGESSIPYTTTNHSSTIFATFITCSTFTICSTFTTFTTCTIAIVATTSTTS